MKNETRALGAKIVGERRSLENAIQKLSVQDPKAGIDAAVYAIQRLQALHIKLVRAEIARLELNAWRARQHNAPSMVDVIRKGDATHTR